VRTQAEASRTQAKATLEQVRIARRLAALEVSLTLADRAFDVRRALIEEPTVVDAFLRANPTLEETYARAGGLRAVVMLRKLLDNTHDIYLLRREGVASDAHWRNWTAALLRSPTCPSCASCSTTLSNGACSTADSWISCAPSCKAHRFRTRRSMAPWGGGPEVTTTSYRRCPPGAWFLGPRTESYTS
jgi:hypothetical protein